MVAAREKREVPYLSYGLLCAGPRATMTVPLKNFPFLFVFSILTASKWLHSCFFAQFHPLKTPSIFKARGWSRGRCTSEAKWVLRVV